MPSEIEQNFVDLSANIMEHVAPIFFGDPETAAMKVLGGITMTTTFPLLVQFEFHPASMEAAAAAAYLHEVLNADPAVPGLRIPTCLTPNDGSGAPPEPAVATEADRVLVVSLADDYLAVAASKRTKPNSARSPRPLGTASCQCSSPTVRGPSTSGSTTRTSFERGRSTGSKSGTSSSRGVSFIC
jgi:hypothetical protein